MKRRSFIKTGSLAGLAIIAFPAYSIALPNITPDELIGKGSPELLGKGFKLRKEAYSAFIKMQSEATKENINIQIVSSFRDFNHQNRIWKRKYMAYTSQGLSALDAIQKIIEYSTIPGTSRHHWGTDIDIIDGNPKQPKDVLLTKHFDEDGPYKRLKDWLDTYANDFGYYLVYTANEERKGFKYEPWHYSYKPLSRIYLKEYMKLDILKLLKKENIIGKEYFSDDFFSSYLENNILDINPELLP